MGLDSDLRTEIIAASTTLGQRVHQNSVPQHQANLFPRCWFAKSGREEVPDLDGTRGTMRTTSYDIECISDSLAEADAAAEALYVLNGKRGTFGAGSVKGCFVEDQDDDYVPRGTGEDFGLHVSSIRVSIVST